MYIYAVFNESDKCIYVGQTIDIERRLREHSANYGKGVHFDYFECSDSEANNEEAKLIVRYKPENNRSIPPNDLFLKHNDLKDKIDGYVEFALREQTPVFRPVSNYPKATVWYEGFDIELFLDAIRVKLESDIRLKGF